MNTALVRLGLELCDEVERLAPLTRPRRDKGVDLTAARLSVRAERMRGVVEQAHAGRGVPAEQARHLDEYAQTVVDVAKDWLARDVAHDDDGTTSARLVIERGELFRSLLKKSDFGAS